MKNVKLLLTGLLLTVAFVGWAQEDESKKMLKMQVPEKAQIDDRIDNMGYWNMLAKKGMVPVQQKVTVPEARNFDSQIRSLLATTEDSPDVVVTEDASHQTENSIFIDPNNNQTALNSNNSGPDGGVYGASGFYTDDAGLSWYGSIQGTGGDNSGDPAVAIGTIGRAYNGFIHSSGGQGVAYTDDQGANWTSVLVGESPSGWNSMLDKNHLWIDNAPSSAYAGNVYSAWTAFGGANDKEIQVVSSSDNGENWSIPQVVSSNINAGSHNQGVNVQTGPNGEVYMVWAIYDNWPVDENALAFSRSFDGGQTWESYRIHDDIRGIRTSETSKNMRVNSFPSMTVDISGGANNGAIYITWANIGEPGVNTGDDIDVYMIKSTDQGENWGDPIRVNQDEAGQGHEHFFPWIACDPITGFISVIFYDDRNVGGNQLEVFVANSIDGGLSWEDFKVSDIAFTPSPIPGLADGYFGDYLSIDAHGGMVYPCWTDNRSGNALTYVSPFLLGPPPNTPWIVYESHNINDPSGNNNGLVDFGESVTVDLELYNWGDTDAQDVNITVSTASPYVTLTDNTEAYGDIASDQTLMIENAIAFTVDNTIPDGTQVIFDILAIDANNTEYNTSFSVTVSAPALAIGSRTIDDDTGNNNSLLDPGEVLTYSVAVTNPGTYSADNATISMASDNGHVTISNPTQEIGDIAAGQTVMVDFEITVDGTAGLGSQVSLYTEINSDYHQASKNFVEKIGLLIEDWESGDLSAFDWVNDNASPWVIDNEVVYEGEYSLRSGEISHGGSTTLSITIETMSDDIISFYRKVSSEGNFDKLKFYIDGSMIAEWSGELDWEYVEYDFLQGEHTFMWEYMKDGSDNGGQDRAWIDNIILPVPLQTTAFAGLDDAACDGEAFLTQGNATYYQSLEWTTNGDGTFDDNTTLDAEYTPGTQDLTNGSVELTLTVTQGTDTETDTMVLAFFESATSFAGENMEICGGMGYELTDATAENHTSVIWTTNGDGVFNDPTLINPVYTPGTYDNEQGIATLTMTAKGSGGCDGVSTVELTLKPFPTATLDLDESTLCLGEFTDVVISLTGVAPWIIEFNGEQIYQGSENEVNVSLQPTESGAQYVIVTDAGGCSNESETEIMFTVLDAAILDMLADSSTCASNSIVLDATQEGDYTYLWNPGNENTPVITVDSTGAGFGEKQVTAIVTNNETNCVVEKTITVTFQDCTGLDENVGNLQISMYPNPASTELRLEMSSKNTESSSLEITDLSGRIVYKELITTGPSTIKKKLDVSFLAGGTYFVNIKNNQQSVSKKLIIQK